MKSRATHKVDLSNFIRQLDISGNAVVDVLVGPSGEVVCMKTTATLPLIRPEVEKALGSWRFKPAEVNGRPVAYVGRLQFTLCNILCGDEGNSMTLLK